MNQLSSTRLDDKLNGILIALAAVAFLVLGADAALHDPAEGQIAAATSAAASAVYVAKL